MRTNGETRIAQRNIGIGFYIIGASCIRDCQELTKAL